MSAETALTRRVVFVAAALFVFTDGPLFFLSNVLLGRPGPSWEDEVVFSGLLGTACAAGLLALHDAWRWHGRRPLAPSAPGAGAVAAFTVLIAASTAWSVDALHTGWRSAVYLGLAMLAWLAASLGRRVQGSLTLMAAAAVSSSIAVLASGHASGVDHNGDWQGVYQGRNLLAPVAAIGVIAGVRLFVRPFTAEPRAAFGNDPDGAVGMTDYGGGEPSNAGRHRRSPRSRGALNDETGRGRSRMGGHLRSRVAHEALGEQTKRLESSARPRLPSLIVRGRTAGAVLAAGSLALMLGAGSRTAWLALLAGCWITSIPLIRVAAARRLGRRAGELAAWASLAAGIAVGAAVAALLWHAPTFAQRRTIWAVCWDQFLERPLLGHGFSAVWTWPQFLDNHELLDHGSAHNAALEVLLGLGVIGLAPFAAIVVLAVRNSARDLWRSPSADTWMWASVVAVMLIENLTESFILRMSYNWVIVTAAALSRSLRADGRDVPRTDS